MPKKGSLQIKLTPEGDNLEGIGFVVWWFVEFPSETEVTDAKEAAIGIEKVRRLEIAMQISTTVHVFHRTD